MKNIKFVLIGLVIGIAISQFTNVFADMQKVDAFFNDIQISVNGKAVDTGKDKPFLYNGRTYVPTRYVAEALGATVKWNETTNTVEIDSLVASPEPIVLKLTPAPSPTPTVAPTVTPTPTATLFITSVPIPTVIPTPIPTVAPTPIPTPVPIEFNKVFSKGSEASLDMRPIEKNGEILMPVRLIAGSLDLSVSWDATTKQITFQSNITNDVLIMTIGSDEGIFNGTTMKMATPAEIIDGRTVVPAKKIVECFNGIIEVDYVNRIIRLGTP